MRALRVGEDFFLNADSVEVVQRYGTRPGMRELKRAKEAGTLHNATRAKQARSLITLKSGWVVVSTYAPETLVSRPLVVPPTRPGARSVAGTRQGEDWEEDDFLGDLENRSPTTK